MNTKRPLRMTLQDNSIFTVRGADGTTIPATFEMWRHAVDAVWSQAATNGGQTYCVVRYDGGVTVSLPAQRR